MTAPLRLAARGSASVLDTGTSSTHPESGYDLFHIMVTDTIFGFWLRRPGPGWLQVLSEYVPSSPTNNSKIKGGEDTRGHIMGYGGESYYDHDDDYNSSSSV